MAPPTWILLFCMLLSAVPFSKGIDFYITRTLGSDYCANIDCSHDVNQQENGKFNIRKIVLYDVTNADDKFQLAYRVAGDSDLFVDPTKANDINGSAEVSKFRARLQLNLRSPSECQYQTFQCSVEYIDALGKKQVVQKTIAPDTPEVDDDCSCSSITYRLNRLTYRANGATRMNYGLKLNLDNLVVDLENIKNDTTGLSEFIAELKESHENIRTAVVGLKEGVRGIDRYLNELEHNASAIAAAIDDGRITVDDIKDNIAIRLGHDKNIDKRLSVFTQNNKVQFEAIGSLQETDGVLKDEFINLQGSDDDFEELVNALTNKSSSLRNQLSGLEDIYDELREDITELNADAAEMGGSIKKLNQKDTGIDRGLAELKRNNIDLQEHAAQLQHATAAKENEINGLSKTYSDLGGLITTLAQNDQSIDVGILGLENKDVDIKNVFNVRLEVDEKLQEALDALTTTNNAHQQNIVNIKRNNSFQSLQIADIRIKDRVIEEVMNDATRNSSAIRGGLAVVRSQQNNIRDMLDAMTNQMLVIESQVNVTKITTESKTKSTLFLNSCTRGMTHDNDRAAVVLFGSIRTMCDTVTAGGGWIVFLSRGDGGTDFNRPWADYRKGFGSPNSDFYLGNKNIANLTARRDVELRIDLIDHRGRSSYAHYDNFSIGGEESNYKLHVSGYDGNAGDSLSYHDGMEFSTTDEDNDASEKDCAEIHRGGWWFNDCLESFLTGVLGAGGDTGVVWHTISKDKSLKFAEAKIRFKD